MGSIPTVRSNYNRPCRYLDHLKSPKTANISHQRLIRVLEMIKTCSFFHCSALEDGVSQNLLDKNNFEVGEEKWKTMLTLAC